jgi:outer membrane protein
MIRFLALALFIPSLAFAQEPTDVPARPIALDDAVRLAQRNSLLAVQTRGEMRVSRSAVRSAYFAFIPSVGLSMSSTWRRGQFVNEEGDLFPFQGKAKSYSDGIGASVDLFDGGQRFFDIRAARARLDAAESRDLLQEYIVALDVKEQYFNVLAAREAEEAARAQLREAEQQLRVSTVRLSAGAASRSDSLRSVVTVGNARLAILDAENRIQLANASLTRMVGTGFTVTASPDTSTEPALDISPEQLFALADQGPYVQQAEADHVAARAVARSRKTLYLPTVSASFQRSGSGFDSGFGLRDTYGYSNFFRLALSFPLLDQLQREQSVVRANVDEDNAEANVRDARGRARQELTQMYGLFRNAGQRVAVQLVSVAATEEDLRFQQQRYALGAATVLDVLTSQSALNQARNALITARFDQRVARARLEALIGRPLSEVR